MKKTILKLLPMAISILLCLGALLTTTFAWFAMNKEVTSDSMKLKVDVLPNLVIDVDKDDLQDITAAEGQNDPSHYTQEFSVLSVPALIPSTHVGSSATGLRYVINPQVISRNTGLQAGSSALTFSDAVNASSPAVRPLYYVDYVVYIAATKSEVAVSALNVTLEGCTIAGDTLAELQDSIDAAEGLAKIPYQKSYDTLAAASIDFYTGTTDDFTINASSYRGTLNVIGYDASANNYTTTLTAVDIKPSGTVPHNESGFIKVVMRCYIDGALLKGSGQAFINSAMVDLSDIELNVKISAVAS